MNPAEYAFKKGDLFIGENNGERLGITTNRHAITVAGSRTGKGVGVINTNLRTWPHNVLVIDPKGEAASVSWEARRDMGQAVHVLDPFERAQVPTEIRASYNPLHDLDATSLTIKEDIAAIADGIVMRSGDAGAVVWDNGAVQLLTGLIAFVLAHIKSEDQNLITVRRILTDQKEGGLFDTAIDKMAHASDGGLGALMRAGASRANAKEGSYYVSGAESNTDWLDSQGMQNILSKSTFSMRDLKREKASVFVALPFKYLPQQQHGRFLRLMVRCGINAMQEPMPNGSDMGEKCLFILDEFFSLGYIDEVATSVGGMASYGLHLWPFLQDLDQLWKLYGRDGAGTFFGSSDLHQFFGVTDPETLKFISERIGAFTVDDMPHEPVMDRSRWEASTAALEKVEKRGGLDLFGGRLGKARGINQRRQYEWEEDHEIYRERLQRYNTEVSRILGKPRLSPQQVAHLIQIEKEKPTAAAQIAFVRGTKPLVCRLSRYYEWDDGQSSLRDYPFSTPLSQFTHQGRTIETSRGTPTPKQKTGLAYKTGYFCRKAVEKLLNR